MKIKAVLGALWLSLLCVVPGWGAEWRPRPTIVELFRPYRTDSASFSPNGEWFSAIHTGEDDISNLLLFNLKTLKVKGVRGEGRLDVYSYLWMNDERILFNVSKDKLYAFGLFAADLGNLDKNFAVNMYDATRIIGVPKARPNHALVWITGDAEDEGRVGDLVELNSRLSVKSLRGTIDSNKSVVRHYRAPKGYDVIAWETDAQGELALCVTYKDSRFQLHRYLPETSQWRLIEIDHRRFSLVELDPDGTHLWVVEHDQAEGFRLRTFHIGTGELGEPVHTDARYDLSDAKLHFSRKDQKLAGLTYERERLHHVWLKPEFAAAQATVDKNYGDWDNQLVDFDQSEQRFLFFGYSDRHAGTYLLLDLEQKTLRGVLSNGGHLEGKALAATQPYKYQARDGLELEGYLTLPSGGAKNPPLVVLAHGGPWARDIWGFDPEVQFLASLGYAVLQPNYRGSSGYVPAISEDSRFDYLKMHEDVVDATKAMQTSGLIDPQRVAIMGTSFGGYLAMTGVAFEPELYRCAVSVCGVFDWEQHIKSKKRSGTWAYSFLKDRLGEPGKDREYFESISPLSKVQDIRSPVFIAHGKEDRVVSVAQSKKLVSALKKQKVPYETFYRDLEGHGFYNYKNQVEFYHEVEKFLAKYLK